MKGVVAQLCGLAVILIAVGGWWMLDLFGCAFNTAGCARVLPRLSPEVALALAVPVGAGLALILWGRRSARPVKPE